MPVKISKRCQYDIEYEPSQKGLLFGKWAQLEKAVNESFPEVILRAYSTSALLFIDPQNESPEYLDGIRMAIDNWFALQ